MSSSSTTASQQAVAGSSSNNAQASKDVAAAAESSTPQSQPLIMQIIMDRSLIGQPDWSLGPLLAQASHASIAVIAQTLLSSRDTQEYISAGNLPNMHKVVLQTASKGACSDLRDLSKRLEEARAANTAAEGEDVFPEHYLWIEQPENIPTCIAIAPNRKPQALKKILNKCSLLRQ